MSGWSETRTLVRANFRLERRTSVARSLLAGFIGSASQTAGNGYLLTSIGAVAVGGTPFTGGSGNVVASAVAALFLAQLGQGGLALGASAAAQLLVQVCAILGAAIIRHVQDIAGELGVGQAEKGTAMIFAFYRCPDQGEIGLRF